ncbi:molybdopterin synthase sulfur carrier subunit [Halarchaeum grantii]|uniref:Molybdopterin synthase sulfur carrier subunit n=1 Tax=Halarchaeum grantii TaxID=1193105 RepID=A0A830F031_9EURY|nr:ubiquitin-like small modifier protein 1 [Halarchaeum grantii]GGL26916.1 molybdopterin synthase sulfur carrier subunit [Halarchaeum grantii]
MDWKLFADLAEVAGDDEPSVRVGDDATVRDALDALIDAHPALAERVLDDDGTPHEHVNLLRNGQRAELDERVDAGDELALFPPVSGG